MLIVSIIIITVSVLLICFIIIGRHIERQWNALEEVPPRIMEDIRNDIDVDNFNEVWEHIAKERKKMYNDKDVKSHVNNNN
jgi:hypothetical protein